MRFLCFALVLFTGLWLSAQGNDPVSIEISVNPFIPGSLADTNPVKTQHTVVATVKDAQGNPLPNQRVEWILARGPIAVGDIVEHDDMNAFVGGSEQKVLKLGNHYTVTYTNDRPVVLDFGNQDARDDIKLDIGQTWITITSPLEGDTNIIAFCPAIKNAKYHKVFGVKHWIDANIIWPEDAVNPVGTPHTFAFQMVKASTGAPYTGYRVKWELVDTGIGGYLNDPGTKEFETQTDAEGKASIILNQDVGQTVEGMNKIKITLSDPENKKLAENVVTKTWISPKLMVKKDGPAEGIINEKVVYTITISNPGATEANEVVVKDTLPDGLSYIDCTIPPSDVQGKVLIWNIGNVAKDEIKTMSLTTKAEKVGTWKNVVEATCKQSTPEPSMVETTIGAPDLYIVKDGPAEIRKDNMARYVITLKNNGNAVANDVQVIDQLPAGMDYMGRNKGFLMKWPAITLQPGDTKAYTYDLKAIQTGVFVNTAKVTLKGKEVHKADCRTKVIAPILKLTKDGPGRVILNKPFEYTIIINNVGDAVAKDMVLVDMLPTDLEYVSATPEPNSIKPAAGQELSTLTWKLGDIQPEQRIEIALKVRAINIARCRNTAKLFSNSPELPILQPLEAYADTTIEGVAAMHINTYDTEDPVEIGKQTIYVVEIRNEGTSDCTNVRMENLLDEEMEFVAAQGYTQNQTEIPYKVEGNTVFFDPVPILQPNAKVTYKITGRAIKEGCAKHKASLRYDQFDKVISSEEGTNCYK